MKEIQKARLSRRHLLSLGVGTAGLALGSKALAVCGEATPAQVEGPFYPIKDQADKDNDLTRVRGKSQRAQGRVIHMLGQVTDQNCQPLEGVLVEIWQACHTGKYDHPGDPNPNPMDPNFQYWGRSVTDANGNYSFKTILPGAYQAAPDWIRPPHIHLKAHQNGEEKLTTQVYFKGNQYNAGDRILQSLSSEEQEKVVIALKRVTIDGEETLAGEFNISL